MVESRRLQHAAGGVPRLPQREFQSRVVIEYVQPEIDSGRFPIKRVVGEKVHVSASIHTDGHNEIAAALLYKHDEESDWRVVEMQSAGPGLDLYVAEFEPERLGYYQYTMQAWIDLFANWRHDTSKKIAAGQDIAVEIAEGKNLIEMALARAGGAHRTAELQHYLSMLQDAHALSQASPLFRDARLKELMFEFAERGRICRYDRVLDVMVEPTYALFSSWYELFPRSTSEASGKHGSFRDVIARLPYVAEMGFDVLYLPPIHPIGLSKRKGKNNTLTPAASDPGSPWAIGSAGGGHKAVHSELGSLEDFRSLVENAGKFGIRIALDIAFQCSPDHPYVKEHPEWFYHRPDGSIKYAENPPKKYEDIYPLNFECDAWESLWEELTGVVLFWVEQGVHVFRVDNPHTKPYAFWKYLIDRVKQAHPDVIFLSEAFSRPRVMQQLAKCGFSQSYTYFTWRTSKWELMDYLSELTRSGVSEYLRSNFFANTPDILPENLQHGGRHAFMIRATLAATLSAAWGIYGPAYEQGIDEAVPGTEEYANSEKYEIKTWGWDTAGDTIAPYITRLNAIRKSNPALQNNRTLRFLEIDNNDLIAYCKTSPGTADIVIVVVNLDPYNAQSGYLTLPLEEMGIGSTYQVHDLITNRRYNWTSPTNMVHLAPSAPACIFKLRKKTHRESDFDYFS